MAARTLTWLAAAALAVVITRPIPGLVAPSSIPSPPQLGALCDGVWAELLQDPAVQQALDDAWKNTKEGTPDEREIGGIIYECEDINQPGKPILVIETFPGDHDSGEIPVNPGIGCKTVTFFHTHPGKGEDDKYKYEVPSDTDMDTSASQQVPGLFIFGEGPDPANTTKVVFDGGGNYEICDDPPDPTPSAPPSNAPSDGDGNTGKSSGDPHLTTFDGYLYDFQAAGEFVLVRSIEGDLEVQVRQEPPTADARNVTVNTAAVVRMDGAIVEVTGAEVIVDGVAHDRSPRGETIALPGGGEVIITPRLADYRAADGTRVLHAGRAVVISLADGRAGSVEGLLGNFDGDRNNDLVAGGELLLADGVAAFDELYGPFRTAWQVTEQSSLFTYSEGRSTADYAIDEIPHAPAIVGFLPRRVRDQASATCAAAGVTEPELLADCILDVGVTGDPSFATAAVEVADLVKRINRSPAIPALVVAARDGRLAQVEQLLAAGADVDEVAPEDGTSALIAAAEGNRLAVIRALIGAGAAVDLAADNGTTALLGAARWGQQDAAALLLAAGADVTARDQRGRTALSLAATRGDPATIAVLDNAGAEIDAEDDDGRSALSWAIVGGDLDTVRALVAARADLNHADASGNTPLHGAALWGLSSIVELLLDAGADPSITNANGQTPADIAAAAGRTELAERLRR